MSGFMNRHGGKSDRDVLHYKACGLDDVYLANGFKREVLDGEKYIIVPDLDGLWKAIGLSLVSGRKVLAPRELRFLREHMRMARAELAAKLRVAPQIVGRWETGEDSVPGPADLMIRVLFLASDIAQPEGQGVLKRLNVLVDDIVAYDEDVSRGIVFRHSNDKRAWTEARLECA